jgi:hypothetical protein
VSTCSCHEPLWRHDLRRNRGRHAPLGQEVLHARSRPAATHSPRTA